MQRRDQLSPSNPVRPQVGTSSFKIVPLARVVRKRGLTSQGTKAPRRPAYILTYPAACMIMIELIVRNPIGRQDFGAPIVCLPLIISEARGGAE